MIGKKMKITASELSGILDIEYLQASLLLKMLLQTGVASEAEAVRSNKRGRPTIKYNVPDIITINLFEGRVEHG